MKATEHVKKRLYALIEKSEDEQLLEIVHEILNRQERRPNERIHLTENQERELMDAYKESFEESNLNCQSEK